MPDVAERRTRARVAPFVALAVAVVVGALLVVLAGSDGGDAAIDSFLIDRPAPAVVSTSLDDEPFELARRKGSWVVLNFFDPTCIPCVDEHPELVTFAAEQERLTDGAELYTVINDGSDEAVRDFFDREGGSWPVVRDPTGSISTSFGVAQVPETWIVDPFGVVRARFAGEVTAERLGGVLQQLREAT